MVNYKDNPRLDVFKSELVKDAFFSHRYEFPILEKSYEKPRKAIPFDQITKAKDNAQWVHFYIHDYRFERIWNNPKQYLNLLKRFEGVITPDFSLYRELPLAMQIWNTYRNRALAYWLQSNGISNVPNISWSDERSYNFAFEGLKKGGSVAVSTHGCIQNKIDRQYFAEGFCHMVESLEPETVIVYGRTPDELFLSYKQKGIEIIGIECYAATVGKAAV